MAYPINVDNVFSVTIRSGTPDGVTNLNVLHYRYIVSQSNPSFVDFIDTFVHPRLTLPGGIIPTMRGVYSNVCAIDEIWYQLISPTRYVKYTKEINLLGQVNSPAMPPNVAVTFTKSTELAKRYGIGSFHLGCLPENINDSGNVDQFTYATPLNAIAAAILAPITAGGTIYAVPVLYSPKPPFRTTEVQTVRYQRTMRVMRRRTVGVGI